MKKIRFYFDKDKEEKWINEMSQKGYAFERFFLGLYTFMPCEPGAFHYQIDLLENDNQKEKDFLELMEETEVEIVARWFRWVFLRRTAKLGEFQLYSDNASKATQYERLGRFYILLMLLEVLCSWSIVNSTINQSSFKTFFSFFSLLAISFVILFAILTIRSFSKAKELRKEL